MKNKASIETLLFLSLSLSLISYLHRSFMICVNSSELVARFQTPTTYLWFVYISWVETLSVCFYCLSWWCIDGKPFSSAGWFCWQRVLQFGDVHIPAGAESQVARPHHTSAWKPWKQTDHPGLWILWWDLIHGKWQSASGQLCTLMPPVQPVIHLCGFALQMSARQNMETQMPGAIAPKFSIC